MKSREKNINKIELLKTSIKQSFLSLHSFLSIGLGGVLVLFLLLNSAFKKPLLESIMWGSLVYIVLFLSILYYKSFKLFVKEFSNLGEYNSYAEATIKLSYAFTALHKLSREENLTFNQLVSGLEEFCSLIKKSYDEILNSETNVSIKIVLKKNDLLGLEEDDRKVITLCRDNSSKNEREPKTANILHTIKANSCYSHFTKNIGKKKGRYYINNNLVADLSYSNSSSKYYGEVPDDVTKEEEREKLWKLPYKSELVVQIAPLNKENNILDTIGYLCVDCKDKNEFLERYDPFILAGVSDGMYNIIKKFYENNDVI